MRTVNIYAAKTHLSRLVEEAAAGEEIIIAKSGKPVARLCPLAELHKKRVLGRLRGKIVIPNESDTLCEDEIRELFEKGCYCASCSTSISVRQTRSAAPRSPRVGLPQGKLE